MRSSTILIRRVNRISQGRQSISRGHPCHQSTDAKNLDAFFETPSWSVKDLLDKPPISEITTAQLNHLLRLSALSRPRSEEEENRLVRALNDHLGFVKEIQTVDTTGVEPLCAIQDGTPEAVQDRMFTLDSMKEAMDREEVHGPHRRIEKKPRDISTEPDPERWSVLGSAERKVGRYFVVDKPNSETQA